MDNLYYLSRLFWLIQALIIIDTIDTDWPINDSGPEHKLCSGPVEPHLTADTAGKIVSTGHDVSYA